MPGDRANGDPRAAPPDDALWRRSLAIDVAEDEAEYFLDLAGYADDRLDPDERDRIAERLAKDPMAAADVSAARNVRRKAAAAGPTASSPGLPSLGRSSSASAHPLQPSRAIASAQAFRSSEPLPSAT